jgi:diguanylate cyclase (GGDEF)-like protein/PAS domain S-box-containing protein
MLFMVTLAYTGQRIWLKSLNKLLMSIIPVLTIMFAWTNEWHQLIWQDLSVVPAGGLYLASFSPGSWYWINVGYSYLAIIAGILILVRAYQNHPILYRKQILVILAGLSLPFLGHIAYIVALSFGSPMTTINWWGYTLILTALILSWGVSHYQLFEIMPVARDVIFDSMDDGVVVLDGHERIVDLNPAAQTIWGWNRQDVIGRSFPDFLSTQQSSLLEKASSHSSLQVEMDIMDRTLDINVCPVLKTGERLGGRLIVLRDITARKEAEDSLSHAHEKLQAQYAEVQMLQTELKQQAILDPLTGLFNRRYLEEIVPQTLTNLEEQQKSYSLAIIDLDHFKLINDRYGHKAGDIILTTLGKFLHKRIRRGDIACRYGGDEFVVFLPGSSLTNAVIRVDDLRKTFGEMELVFDGDHLRTTFSAGVAAFPAQGSTFDQILLAADRALYAAKMAGRNSVLPAHEDARLIV